MSKLNSATMIFGLFLFVSIGSVLCFQDQETKSTYITKRSISQSCQVQKDIGAMKKAIADLQGQVTANQKIIKSIYALLHKPKTGKNCAELYQGGMRQNGIYDIDPDGKGKFKVLCDMNGGGWTVFQRRLDGSVDFFRGWQDYKNGFGDLNGEFWLGLDKIHRLTAHVQNKLRVDLEDTSGNKKFAEYNFFAVTSERKKYQLSLGTYSGNAGDSLGWHKGAPFSTKDSDNDAYKGKCAHNHKGAWWYTKCHASNLNGQYHHGTHDSYADGINWSAWKGQHYSLKSTSMKIRPLVLGPRKK